MSPIDWSAIDWTSLVVLSLVVLIATRIGERPRVNRMSFSSDLSIALSWCRTPASY
jgi:hypothetical protein